MPGIIMPPTEATSATAVPEIPPKSIEAAILACASPPRIQPTRAFAKRIIRSVMPPEFIRLPARMNPGMQSRTKLSIPAYIFCGMTTKGMSANRR